MPPLAHDAGAQIAILLLIDDVAHACVEAHVPPDIGSIHTCPAAQADPPLAHDFAIHALELAPVNTLHICVEPHAVPQFCV